MVITREVTLNITHDDLKAVAQELYDDSMIDDISSYDVLARLIEMATDYEFEGDTDQIQAWKDAMSDEDIDYISKYLRELYLEYVQEQTDKNWNRLFKRQ